MTYLYVFTRVVTYFGTELRTFWEHIICRIFNILAEDVRTFKSSEMCGHIEHEIIKSFAASFWMCFFPFAMNFSIGIMMLLTGSYRIFYIGDISLLGILFLWLGVSLLSNCVPSFEDVLSFKDNLYKGKTNILLKIIFSPYFAIVYVLSLLERYSITFVLAILFSIVFPSLFSALFPILAEIILK